MLIKLMPETALKLMQQLKEMRLTNEKSRLNVDISGVKIHCGELTIQFNMKDISCSEIINILLENDILIKKYSFN